MRCKNPKRITNFRDITGMKFNHLTAIRFCQETKYQSWECRCDCGNIYVANAHRLRNYMIDNCGCLRKQQMVAPHITHGKTNSKEFKIWLHMRQRCYLQTFIGWDRYGGRGIKVCPSWDKSFEQFLDDMGKCPDGYWLDRIDNDGDYEPKNCRWATPKEQANNRSNNRIIEFNDMRLNVTQWAERIGISKSTLASRIREGWSTKNAIETPIHFRGQERD